jgi:AcrR family transcriptional regulator
MTVHGGTSQAQRDIIGRRSGSDQIATYAPPVMRFTTPAPKQQRSHATRRRLLDAAVEELLRVGYGGLTTSGVALRAGVSRGAQQHHFPDKAALVAEAVKHLATMQLDELRAGARRTMRGRARVECALELIYEQYNGALFTAILELALAARHDEDLHAVVTDAEREISRALGNAADEVLGDDVARQEGFAERWAMVLSTVRGLAMLRLLGHPERSVERQWRATRPALVQLLFGGEMSHEGRRTT